MLNLKIYSYEEKNPGIKYDTGFLSGEDYLIGLALKIYNKEQFEILWDFLDGISDYISDVADKIEDSAYKVSFYAYIIDSMRKNEERYNKFLDYLVEQNYGYQEYFKNNSQEAVKRLEAKGINNLDHFEYQFLEKQRKYLNSPDRIFTRESVEIDFLRKYQVVFSVIE